MALAIFDLDHTLIDGDSDYLWGEYMIAAGIVDADEYRRINRSFLEDYQSGTLDNEKFLRFALHPLSCHPLEKLYAWRRDYVDTWIRPIIAPGTPVLLEKHRKQGDILIIVSATNFFITEPIAELLEIPNLLSTRPELVDGRYTGRFVGTPTFREGKVTVLRQWLAQHDHSLDDSYFYSDSINDLPLLEAVGQPVTVNPDERLLEIARLREWPIIDLRNPEDSVRGT